MKFKSPLHIAAGAALVVALSPLQAATEIVPGYHASIEEFTSPDVLHLDPSSVIIAVDAFGDEDREVNGVLFQTDRCDGCPDTEGEVESGAGVTYRSTSTHFIDGWAVPPIFSGADQDSADNLSAIMEDIRWSAAPSPVTIELDGLPAGAAIEVQLLFDEGADRNRRWDIGVVDGDPEDIDEDGLIFDDIQSEGISADSDLGDEMAWTDENSVVARFTANASGDGKLTIVMQQHIGGQDSPGGDNNPILQAAIFHSASSGVDITHGKEEIVDEGGPDGWDLTVFVVDPLLTSDDTDADGTPDGTVTSWTAAFREDRADGEHTAAPVLARRDTESGEITVVGVGDLVTPEAGEESITLPWGVGTGSNAIDLTQQNTEWLMGLYQGGPNGDNAGAVVPFAGGGEYPMFAWNTADVPPEPDEVVVPGHASYDAPAAREYQFNFTVTWGGGGSSDRDNDGLPNFYEEANGLDPDDPADAASDGDNDGLTALEEFERRTDITKADTDGDGLNDKVESNTGVWVSAEDTGTDPRKADTDKDKLPDGVETNTGVFVDATNAGTDPHKKDSDGDGFSDSNEIANASDPTKSGSVPDLDPIVILGEGTDALLGGDLTDPEDDGDEFAGEDDPSWNWVSIDSNDEPGFEGGEFSYNVFDNVLSGGNGKWCCTNATEDNPLQLTVEFEEPIVLTHFTISSANDVPSQPLDWQIQGSNDGEEFTPIFIREDDEPIWEDQVRFQVVLVTLQNLPPPYKFIRYEVTRTAGAGAHQLGELEYFGGPGTSVPFQITNIVRAVDGITLTWASRSSKEYSIEHIETLSADGVWVELDDGVASEGDETSFTDDDAARIALPEGWYRVREN